MVQVNVGLYCNMSCTHCHVESGPTRHEVLTLADAERVVQLLKNSKHVTHLDLTGGAPELCPSFRYLVKEGKKLGLIVSDRCNLIVIYEKGQEDLLDFLVHNQVQISASLPCYSVENVDKQRGKGTFSKSIQALIDLNKRGYGINPELNLDLVYNPSSPKLPGDQKKLEKAYKRELKENFGIQFNRLFCVTNSPIKRYYDFLEVKGELNTYFNLLVNSFNPATVKNTMCHDTINVNWNADLYDCDFNQALDKKIPIENPNIWKIDSFDELLNKKIATDKHCFACTAGQGSS
jgi:radical SAM/Cys-rich protein